MRGRVWVRWFERQLELADRLGLTLNTQFPQGGEAGLAAALLPLSGVVLVAWEHKAIVQSLLPRLPITGGAAPATWPGDRFDVVLRLDRPAGAAAFTCRMLFPCLLKGDSDQGFGA